MLAQWETELGQVAALLEGIHESMTEEIQPQEQFRICGQVLQEIRNRAGMLKLQFEHGSNYCMGLLQVRMGTGLFRTRAAGADPHRGQRHVRGLGGPRNGRTFQFLKQQRRGAAHASKSALAVSQNNVSNANTPGYARQVAQLESQPFNLSDRPDGRRSIRRDAEHSKRVPQPGGADAALGARLFHGAVEPAGIHSILV